MSPIARSRTLTLVFTDLADSTALKEAWGTFDTPSSAVMLSLRLQRAHLATPDLPRLRIGVHMGEVSERPGDDDAPPRIEGLAVDLAARIAGLARPAQILMSAAVANSARQRIQTRAFDAPLRWETYGTTS